MRTVICSQRMVKTRRCHESTSRGMRLHPRAMSRRCPGCHTYRHLCTHSRRAQSDSMHTQAERQHRLEEKKRKFEQQAAALEISSGLASSRNQERKNKRATAPKLSFVDEEADWNFVIRLSKKRLSGFQNRKWQNYGWLHVLTVINKSTPANSHPAIGKPVE